MVSQNPKIKINNLYGDPKDLGCGGVRWVGEFELPGKAGTVNQPSSPKHEYCRL